MNVKTGKNSILKKLRRQIAMIFKRDGYVCRKKMNLINLQIFERDNEAMRCTRHDPWVDGKWSGKVCCKASRRTEHVGLGYYKNKPLIKYTDHIIGWVERTRLSLAWPENWIKSSLKTESCCSNSASRSIEVVCGMKKPFLMLTRCLLVARDLLYVCMIWYCINGDDNMGQLTGYP